MVYVLGNYRAESIEEDQSIEDQAFLLLWLRTPPPLLPSVSSTVTHRKTENEKQLADGTVEGGKGRGGSQVILQQESLVLYKIIQYSLP
jgi:hypothetical protein